MTITLTHGGIKANTRDAMAELFITAVSTLGGRETRRQTGARTRRVYGGAYEATESRETRLSELTYQVALENPAWTLAFIQWLRDEGHLRTVTQLVATSFVRARLKARVPDETSSRVPGPNRTAINVACGRLTDVGELLETWRTAYGTNLPMPVKRGAADAFVRLCNERAALRADGQRQDWRPADVIELTHPTPTSEWQSALFEWLLNRRHGRKMTEATDLIKLPVISAHESFNTMRAADPVATRDWLLDDPTRIRTAGLSWEIMAGLGKMDAQAWQSVIPSMGYLALVRNLRNFEQANVSVASLAHVQERLIDPTEIDQAGLFPLQFYAAAREVTRDYPSWETPLEMAVNHSLRNVPELPGNTLVLVDVSGSMFYTTSVRSTVQLAEQAQVFGTALAMRCERADLVQFDDSTRVIPFRSYPDGQVLRTARTFSGGGSTDTYGAVKRHLKKEHTRVVIVTDEQSTTEGSIGKKVGPGRSLYIFNVAGYAPTLTTKTMPLHRGFGGLTDQAFRLIPLVESGVKETWPFRY